MKSLRILNEFGIKPTNNYVSAGMDFYVPNISEDKKDIAINAFKDSFKITLVDIENILNALRLIIPNESETFYVNVLHLYLALSSSTLDKISANHSMDKIKLFVTEYLIKEDDIYKTGIKLKLNDAILINSGIRVALDPGTAGIFFNKSGKGNAGFDVRAQVVDEDYTGFVHCSLAYTKETDSTANRVYCGDKITQMVILPVYHLNPQEISSEEYFHIMKDSARGNMAFGSGDIKH